MLEIINIYAHGYVFIPIVHTLKSTPFPTILKTQNNIDINKLEQQLSANSGNFHAALKTLESLGWISITNNHIQLNQRDRFLFFIDKVDDALIQPYHSNILSSPLNNEHISLLKAWIENIRRNKKATDDPIEQDLLDGPMIAPLLIVLKKNIGDLAITSTVLAETLSGELLAAVNELFSLKGWVEHGELNATGQFILERAYNLGMTISYRPMLLQMHELLFGHPETIFAHDENSHESHIDRTLNVIASGFQHEKYFSSVDRILSQLFDDNDLDNQPKYIADMGCGDGAFLHRVYTFVAANTLRGKNLATHPLLLIGADLNQKALRQTEMTLKDIPHLTLEGDVAKPDCLLKSLEANGITDPQNILHIRSFLDHEIPYQGVDNPQAADKRVTTSPRFISVTDKGGLQNPQHIIQRYVEHFSRWAQASSQHGILILEVHTLPARVVQRYFSSNESFHFDAIHSFSRQNLLDAATFAQVAAEAGLFCDSEFHHRFPRAFPYTRVSLNWFRKKTYKLRYATPEDIPSLLELETLCWADGLRADRQALTRRISLNPEGNIVIDYGGEVVGVGYTQRITSEEALYHTSASQVHLLHEEGAPVLQLLAINIHPQRQQMALGDTLLTHLLRVAALQDTVEKVVGVTRCKDYLHHRQQVSYEQYVNQAEENGQHCDPILHFHLSHGAHILGIARHYRPADDENEGHGVLIGYAVRNELDSTQAMSKTPKAFAHYSDAEIDQAITVRLKTLLGKKKLSHYRPTTSFRDMGLDSLDLTELREVINRLLNTRLEAAIFFRFPTPASVIDYLNRLKNQASAPVESPQPTQQNIPRPLTSTTEYRPDSQDIAIVGVGCHFPQNINDKAALWQYLQGADDVASMVTTQRWDPAITSGVKGASYGGFLNNVSLFDASFFGISPREAINMDPQQRLLLETSWEAFEDAGIAPDSLKGSQTGVFIGHFGHDYESLQLKSHTWDDYQPHFSTGSSASVQAGRLSYFYDFHGPAISLNTACSSALVAVHQACKSLQHGECDMAVAGAANLILTPELSLVFGRANMLSAVGKCKTFDASADGYVRSEGCAMVVLKRAQDALDAGDTIQAIIKGSAINQDGSSNGLTAPNGHAQEAVIRAALAQANVAPHEITYVETHGTGTSLGDPVEVEALMNVFAADNTIRAAPLVLGSVKTHLGHTEAVAGLAGLIKSILILKHRNIPATPSISTLNPLVDKQLQRMSVTINQTAMDILEPVSRPRIGISSFGYSGTNVHMVIEEAPSPRGSDAVPASTLPFVLSAKTATALQQQAGKLHQQITDSPEINLTDVAVSLATTRSHFSHRAAIVTAQRQELLQGLSHLSRGETALPEVQKADISHTGKLAMMFTGQGCQYPGMGYACYQQFPAFKQAFDAVCAELGPLMEIQPQTTLRDIIFAEPGGERARLLNQTLFTQPALFTLEVAMFRLFEHWGIKPHLLIGHSIGEVAAAHVAGVLSLKDACTLVTTRSRLMQAQPTGGAMVSLQVSEAEVQPYLIRHEKRVAIAALNGPHATVIAGDETPVMAIAAQVESQGRRATRLTVSHAFHSPHMDGMLDEFRQVLSGLTFHPPKIPIISNLSGKLADATLLCSADYWVRHVRSTVRFSEGIYAAGQQGVTTFLEIGPQGILTSLAQASLNNNAAVSIAPLGREGNDTSTLMAALAQLYLLGQTPNWLTVFPPGSSQRIHLPTYAFQRESYWVEVAKNVLGDSPTPHAQPQPESREAERPQPQISATQMENHQRFMQLQQQLQALNERERTAHMLSVVLDNTAQVLGFKETTRIASDAGFFNSGLDSIMAVELRWQLQEATGIKLPDTLVFDYPTPEAVAQLLAEKFQPPQSPSTPPPHHPSATAVTSGADADLTALDDNDLLAAASALLRGEK